MASVTNVREFTLGLERFKKQANDLRRKRTRAVAIEALRGVVYGTRVDTGRARGNWQVTESTPASGYDQELKDPSGRATASIGATKIEAASGDRTIWLHNGVPYINVLEDWDKMVAGTVARLESWIRSVY